MDVMDIMGSLEVTEIVGAIVRDADEQSRRSPMEQSGKKTAPGWKKT